MTHSSVHRQTICRRCRSLRSIHTTVDYDAANVRSILCEMEGGKADRVSGGSAEIRRVAVVSGDVHGPEGVVQNEDAHARFGSLDQDLAKSIGHPARGAVVQLKGDRLLR